MYEHLEEWAAAVNREDVIRRAAGSAQIYDQEQGRRRALVIAVVGLSSDPERPSHQVAARLQQRGYRILPVNPTAAGERILGEPVFTSLSEIPEKVDVVQVFRNPRYAPEVAKEAAALQGAPILWLQEGVVSEEAVRIASKAGLPVVMDRCLWKEVLRLQGDAPPGDSAASADRPGKEGGEGENS